jgi:hypothetical protein
VPDERCNSLREARCIKGFNTSSNSTFADKPRFDGGFQAQASCEELPGLWVDSSSSFKAGKSKVHIAKELTIPRRSYLKVVFQRCIQNGLGH